MEGINQIYCAVTGRETPMRVKLLLRLLNAVILIVIYKISNIDWVIIYGLVVIVADLDSIAESLHKKFKKDC